MMKNNFHSPAFLFFLSLLTSGSFAQSTFEKMYGGADCEMANAVTATTDGGFILTGQTMSFGDSDGDIYVAKVSSQGDLQWEKHYGSSELDGGNWIIESPGGGYLVIGHTEGWGNGDCEAYILKLSSAGDSLWLRTLGDTEDDAAYCGINSSDNTYVISGIFQDVSTMRSSAFLAKYDLDGNLLWMKKYGTRGNESGKCMIQTQDGSYVIAGYTPDTNNIAARDAFLAKTDEDGNELWEKSFDGDSSEEINNMVETSDDGFFLSGSSIGIIANDHDVFVMRTDAAGNKEWDNYFVDVGNSDSRGLCLAEGSGYVITGTTLSIADTSENIFLMKLNESGEVIWERYFGENEMDMGRGLVNGTEGGYVITGILTHNGNADAALIKTDDGGNITSTNFPANPETVHITPNPAEDILNVAYTGMQNEIFQIEISDAMGKKVKQFNTVPGISTSLDCSSWASGIYFLKITGSMDYVMSPAKIVKQ